MSAHLRLGARLACLFLGLALTVTPLLAHAQAASRAWSTYLGGGGNDRVTGLLQVNASFDIVATGWTSSKDFPPRTGTGADPARDAFVAILTANGFVSGSPFIFGGAGEDLINAAAFGLSGRIYVVGMTTTANMPGFPTNYRSLRGTDDAFLARFKLDGTPEWFMYLDSPGSETATGVTVSGTDVYVTGYTNSCAFLATTGTCMGGQEGFVVKVDDSKQFPTITWSRLVMGSGDDFLTRSVVDGSSVVVVGSTNSSTLGATSVVGNLQGGTDALAARLDVSTGDVTWASYLGNALDDTAAAVLPGTNGETVVIGTVGTPQEGKNIFVSWLNTSGVVQRTLPFGGTSDEVVSSAAKDDPGNIYIAGRTGSQNFPLARAFDGDMEVSSAPQEGFVLTVPAQGGPGWASFVGGNAADDVLALSILDSRIVVAGGTSSSDLATSGSNDSTLGAPPDGFLMALTADISPPRVGTVNDRPQNDSDATDIDTTTSRDSLSANWSGFFDGESGIERYQYAIGTSPGAADVYPFTEISFSGASSYTKDGLSLNVGTTYYFSVRGINGAGLGSTASSNGVVVVPVGTDGGTGGTDGGTGGTDGGTGGTDGGTGGTDGGNGGGETDEDPEALLGFSCTAADAGLPMLLGLLALVLLTRRGGSQSR